MSVSDFIDSLSCSDPEGDLDLVREWFRCAADLTVKLFVCYTSQDRPNGDPFCQYRGSSLPRVGTGMIRHVDSEINKPCPCDKCNGQEVRKYWRFIVRTAQHVVYDTEEAKKTRLDLFYDDETSHQEGKVVSVPALRVVESSAKYDKCSMECVTHDEEIGEMVESLVRRWVSLDKAIRSRSTPFYFNTSSLSDRPREMSTRERQFYSLIISHPHGQAKKITLGKQREGKDFVLDDEVNVVREYQTATCPGSSGAPVFDVYTEVDDAGLRHWVLLHYTLFSYIHSGTHTPTQTSSVSTDQINFGHWELFYSTIERGTERVERTCRHTERKSDRDK